MGISLSLGLWFVIVTTSVAIMTLDLVRPGVAGDQAPPRSARLAVLVIEAVLLIWAMVWLEAQSLFAISPLLTYLLQSGLPLLAALLGGYLAARCFSAMSATWRGRCTYIHSPVGVIALLIALGAGSLIVTGQSGVVMAAAALLTIAMTVATANRLSVARHRKFSLSVAITLLWSGAFLLYLVVFPEQIPVGVERANDGAADSSMAADWIVPIILVSAFVLGFLQRKRG